MVESRVMMSAGLLALNGPALVLVGLAAVAGAAGLGLAAFGSVTGAGVAAGFTAGFAAGAARALEAARVRQGASKAGRMSFEVSGSDAVHLRPDRVEIKA
jgi:hypothetical protein